MPVLARLLPMFRVVAAIGGHVDRTSMEYDMTGDTAKPGGKATAAPGIVIRFAFEPPRRPQVAAFIWGGKVRPVPALPYGRRTA
jgi:hypothetical protein